MRLKHVTTALLVLGIALLLAWQPVVGPQPSASEPERAKLVHVLRMGVYFLAVIVTFFLAGLSAYLLARRTRQQYRQEARQNLNDLIEASLHDHRKSD